jgi:hypothetical protein
MRAATSVLLLGVAPFALSACKKNQQAQEQNIAIDQPVTNEVLANADIETPRPTRAASPAPTSLPTAATTPTSTTSTRPIQTSREQRP